MPDPTELPASPLHALSVYAEPLVAGRRVVLLGDATRQLGERFLSLGARVVHLYDPDAARAASAAGRAPRGLTVLPLPPGEFDVRDGAFDLAVILDLAEFPVPAPLLARVRRLLAPSGAALVRARTEGSARSRGGRPGGAPLDYYELYDLVAMQFAHVRMVGQIPWSGVALAELGRAGEEPDVTVDTQLVAEAGAPDAFIALASQEDVRLAEYALVQLPPAPAVDVEATIAYGNEHADLAAAQLRASLLEAQVEELRGQRNRESAAHTDGKAALEAELARRTSDAKEAEERALDAVRAVEQARGLLRVREEELARLADRAVLVSVELDQERSVRQALEQELARVRGELGRIDVHAREREIAGLRERATLAFRELDEERSARGAADQALVVARRELESLARDVSVASAALLRVPALEALVEELQGVATAQADRLGASDSARARLEAALAEAAMEIDALRQAASERKDTDRAGVVAARVQELLAVVAALEAEAEALSNGHGQELVALEAALRDRAKAAHLLEQELGRRERIILDLVHAFEEARALGATSGAADAATDGRAREVELALVDTQRKLERARGENAELSRKLDAAALEIARREGDSATAAWRIQELEQAVARLEDEQSELTMTIPPPKFVSLERDASDVTVLTRRLATVEDELDVVRQALAQEHAARARAESGEALSQARVELARQAALLEKLSRELEAHDGVRRPIDAVADDSTAPTS